MEVPVTLPILMSSALLSIVCKAEYASMQNLMATEQPPTSAAAKAVMILSYKPSQLTFVSTTQSQVELAQEVF